MAVAKIAAAKAQLLTTSFVAINATVFEDKLFGKLKTTEKNGEVCAVSPGNIWPGPGGVGKPQPLTDR